MKKLIEIKNLKKYFPIKEGFLTKNYVKAVDDISLSINEGEVLGLVGESGCGKSTLGRLILRLIEADSGEVYYKGENILKIPPSRMRNLRKELQIIFQDPYSSLNPRFKVKDIIGEGLDIFYSNKGKNFIENKIDEVLNLVGLSPSIKNRYPHEFSGGQRQRISIARSIVLDPSFIVLDEPVSALDVSIQAQIINLLKDIKQHLGLSYLFIAHDLSVVNYISDNIAVVYLGKIVEYGKAENICNNPQHPYTQTLIEAIPSPNKPLTAKITGIKNTSKTNSGCKFYPRCFCALEKCKTEEPLLKENSDKQIVACHRYE